MNKNIKLDLACSKDDMRPVMNYVYVTREVMVATDAQILAVVPTEDVFSSEKFRSSIPEEGMYIHREDWKKLITAEHGNWKTKGEVIKLYPKNKRSFLIEVESISNVGKYVNWEPVIPDYSERIELHQIGVNLEKAFTLQKVLGLESSKLSFSTVTRAIKVEDAKDKENKVYGIVMPVLLD